jgi:hypothetical protein
MNEEKATQGSAAPLVLRIGDRMRFSRELWDTGFDEDGHTLVVRVVEIRQHDGFLDVVMQKEESKPVEEVKDDTVTAKPSGALDKLDYEFRRFWRVGA